MLPFSRCAAGRPSLPACVDRVRERYARGERLVAPLLGFPGVTQSGTNIKVAQQNHGGHYRVRRRRWNGWCAGTWRRCGVNLAA